MKNCLKIFFVGVIFFTLIVAFIPKEKVHADISSCYAIITPNVTTISTARTYTFHIENSDDTNSATYISISIPSDFTINSGSAGGWTATLQGSIIEFTGGSIPPEQSANFNVTITSGPDETQSNFVVSLGTESDGTGSNSCDGSLTVNVSGSASSSVSIENISLSNITTQTATVNFSTNTSATSTLHYGTTSSYGSTQSISSATTSHSYTVTGLTRNTTYHYQVSATNGSSSDSSDDDTFTTASTEGVVITSTPRPSAGPTATPVPVAADTSAPTVSLEALAANKIKGAPTIKGVAADNTDIASLSYTTDNGKNWYSIKMVTGLTTGAAQFSFTPTVSGDKKWIVKVRAKDSAGNTGMSADFPFTLDGSGPVITITTPLAGPLTQAPIVEGTAVDSAGVASVDFSTDGGKNWQPVTKLTTADTTGHFSFTPDVSDDGTYPLVLRATDGLGNPSQSTPGSLLIDRLPPRVGAGMVVLPPYVLEPGADGVIAAISGVTYTFTTSIIGGPTEANLIVRGSGTAGQAIPLRHNEGIGLWSSDARFSSEGNFTLAVWAKDGAGHEVTKEMGVLSVLRGGTLMGGDDQRVSATVTVLTKDTITGNFVPWDASPYGQNNPRIFSAGQPVSVFLPPGTYYFDIVPQSPFYRRAVTNTITLTQTVPVPVSFRLPLAPAIHLFSWRIPLPTFTRSHLTITGPSYSNVGAGPHTVSYAFPTTILGSGKDTFSVKKVEGKISLVAILNSWMPQSASQLGALDAFAKATGDVTVAVVIPHESASRVSLYKKRGAYTIPIYADPDGEFIEQLPYLTSPTLYEVGKTGRIVSQLAGLASSDDLTSWTSQ